MNQWLDDSMCKYFLAKIFWYVDELCPLTYDTNPFHETKETLTCFVAFIITTNSICRVSSHVVIFTPLCRKCVSCCDWYISPFLCVRLLDRMYKVWIIKQTQFLMYLKKYQSQSSNLRFLDILDTDLRDVFTYCLHHVLLVYACIWDINHWHCCH